MKFVRKVIGIGGSKGVTLPPKWIRGEYVLVEKRDGEIVLKFLEAERNG